MYPRADVMACNNCGGRCAECYKMVSEAYKAGARLCWSAAVAGVAVGAVIGIIIAMAI
jgi:hypothetical protein